MPRRRAVLQRLLTRHVAVGLKCRASRPPFEAVKNLSDKFQNLSDIFSRVSESAEIVVETRRESTRRGAEKRAIGDCQYNSTLTVVLYPKNRTTSPPCRMARPTVSAPTPGTAHGENVGRGRRGARGEDGAGPWGRWAGVANEARPSCGGRGRRCRCRCLRDGSRRKGVPAGRRRCATTGCRTARRHRSAGVPRPPP